MPARTAAESFLKLFQQLGGIVHGGRSQAPANGYGMASRSMHVWIMISSSNWKCRRDTGLGRLLFLQVAAELELGTMEGRSYLEQLLGHTAVPGGIH